MTHASNSIVQLNWARQHNSLWLFLMLFLLRSFSIKKNSVLGNCSDQWRRNVEQIEIKKKMNAMPMNSVISWNCSRLYSDMPAMRYQWVRMNLMREKNWPKTTMLLLLVFFFLTARVHLSIFKSNISDNFQSMLPCANFFVFFFLEIYRLFQTYCLIDIIIQLTWIYFNLIDAAKFVKKEWQKMLLADECESHRTNEWNRSCTKLFFFF